MRMPSLRERLREAYLRRRAAGQATLPTTGRIRGGSVSAAACATRTGSVLTRLTTTRVTITGCRTKPRMKRRRLARADFADTFFADIAEESGRRASDATRRPYHRQRLPYPLLKGEVMRESASHEDTAAAPQNPDDASLVLHVLGARPNFVKAAPVVRALAEL